MDPTIRIRNAEGSLDPEGFPGYQNRLRSLVWIWCGQPGRLENLSSTLTEAATAELRSLGTFDLAFQLDGVFTGLHEQSVKADARRVGRTPASFRYRPAAGVFWRRVFTAFSDAFDIPVLTDPRLAYGDLRGPKAPVRKTVISVDAQTAPDTATLPALLSSVPTMSAHTAKMLRIERPVKPTNVPRDARWDELYLVIDAHRFGYRLRERRGDLGFAEAGFENRRSRGNPPDQLWELLREFARGNGALRLEAVTPDRKANLKQQVYALAGRLRALFPISGRPFRKPKDAPYRAAFHIRQRDGITIRVPNGRT